MVSYPEDFSNVLFIILFVISPIILGVMLHEGGILTLTLLIIGAIYIAVGLLLFFLKEAYQDIYFSYLFAIRTRFFDKSIELIEVSAKEEYDNKYYAQVKEIVLKDSTNSQHTIKVKADEANELTIGSYYYVGTLEIRSTLYRKYLSFIVMPEERTFKSLVERYQQEEKNWNIRAITYNKTAKRIPLGDPR